MTLRAWVMVGFGLIAVAAFFIGGGTAGQFKIETTHGLVVIVLVIGALALWARHG